MHLHSSDGVWRIEPAQGGRVLQVRMDGMLVLTARSVKRVREWLAERGVDLADLVED